MNGDQQRSFTDKFEINFKCRGDINPLHSGQSWKNLVSRLQFQYLSSNYKLVFLVFKNEAFKWKNYLSLTMPSKKSSCYLI